MRRLPVKNVSVGDRFETGLFIDRESMFIAPGLEVRPVDLTRLHKLNVQYVYTNDPPAIGEESLHGSFLQRPLESPHMLEIQQRYTSYLMDYKTVHDAVRQRIPVDNQKILDLVQRILTDLKGREGDTKQFMLYGQQGSSGFLHNALNVAIISALLGKRLQYSDKELRDLTAGALLHDVGMSRIPAEILQKESSLSAEELRLVHTYPVHSYRIITGELSFPDEIGVIGLQHQERWNGGGYPRNLSGKSIHVNARIVAVADAFEAMLSKRPYRSSMDGYNAVRTILRDNGTRFDPDIIKAFIRTFGIYPRGCLVQLNNSAIGRVVEINPDAPLRPQVKVMIDYDGHEFIEDDGPVLDLREERRMFIVQPINQEQLQ
ncbi:MAG: HD-GYP domain-containing protein, partial [Spirochaeta sp.]